MKEYMPGQGSYKVEEAGALTGVPTTYNVDNHWGTLIFDRDDVKIPARGIDISLSSRFNSDHLYSTILHKVSKSDGPQGLSARPVPSTMMTLPSDQTNFYRICNGWSWKLPYVLLGVANAFKFSLGDGKIFDLAATITQEAWGGDTNNGAGWHSWTEGYEVTYGVEAGTVSPVTVVIPEIQVILKLNVVRSGSSPWDFTPQISSLSAYLQDGKVISFTANGLISTIRDPANRNSLSFSYNAEILSGQITESISRSTFTIQPSDYAAVLPGDIIIIGDEMKVVYTKNGSNQISTSSNFDVAIPPGGGKTYTILKGRLREIVHTDSRAVKFYYYDAPGGNTCMTILLSSDSGMDNFVSGDQFLGYYTFGPTNQLVKYEICRDMAHGAMMGGFQADLAANQSTYFGIMQTIGYQYNLTGDTDPRTDQIIVTNNVGAPTIYYFQKGGFCSHSWNNAFFHRGTCRRGGTKQVMMIERPDFYINPNNPGQGTYGYVNINRIDDNAFYQASKDDYQRDENAYDFNSENEFNTQMFLAGQATAAASGAGSILGFIATASSGNAYAIVGSIVGFAAQGAGEGLSVAQYQHAQAKYAKDAEIAKNAPPVSQWVPISTITSPNRITLGAELTQAPRQNDIYAVMNAAPDVQPRLTKTSRNGTRIYLDHTNGGNPFGVGDYLFLRTEFHKINDVGTETWAGGASQNYVEVETPFQFVPDEGEIAAIVRKTNPAIPSAPVFYGYYLNKPKVVRIEFKNSMAADSNYWKRIDYLYNYEVQGMQMSDNFNSGGFSGDNVEGPYNNSFEFSDISLKGTLVTAGMSNVEEDIDFTRAYSEFSYDEKSYHKGVSSESRMRRADDSTDWLFVNKTVNLLGKPCSNAGYYGVKASFYYEGGDPTIVDGGGASWRKKTDFRFDTYGRAVRSTIYSSSYEGRRSKSIWTQYVGSSEFLAQQATPDLDPLGMFGDNYLSGNYQQIIGTFCALGLVGATIEEVDTLGGNKKNFRQYDPTTMNLLMSDIKVVTSLLSYRDILSVDQPNFEAVFGATVVTDPAQIWWNAGGSDQNDWSTAEFDEDDGSTHATTRFAYDSNNNLTTIWKPLGNTINLSYGTSWKSSYVASDYKTLDNNIGGATQYIVTAYDYDIKGRLITKTIRFKTDTAVNDSNLVSYGSSASKTMMQYTYDGMDRLLTKIQGDGSTQTPVIAHSYLDKGDASWANQPYMIATDYMGFRTKSYYDTRYKLLGTEKYKPNQDISGNLAYSSSWEVKVSSEWNVYQPAFEKVAQSYKYSNADEAAVHAVVTQYTYDSLARLTRVQHKNTDTSYQGDSVYRTIQSISYDEASNAVTTQDFIDDAGNFIQKRIENDWLGRGPIKEISWTGQNAGGTKRIVVNRYRQDGKLIRKQLPNGELFLYSYDNTGNLEKMTYPDGTRSAMLYDLNGNIVQTIDRRNVSIAMAFNQSDMVVSKATIDSVRGNTVITTKHTQFGPAQIVVAENGTSLVESNFWYHFTGGMSIQQQTTDSHTMQIGRTFNPAGNQLTITPTGSGASPWTRTFNILSQFHAGNPDTSNFNRIAVVDNSTGKNIITHEPDFLGLSKAIKYGDYVAVVVSMNNAYDKFLRVRTIISGEPTPVLSVTLVRDFMGKIVSHAEPALSPAPAIEQTYLYDGMQRLSSGEGAGETYDELSGLLTKGPATYTYQDVDDDPSYDQMRLSSFNNGIGTSYSYSYDANGNPTSIVNRYTSLSYDNLNRLRQIAYAQTDNFWYNADGLRVKKTENAAGAWKTTYTLFDGDNPLMQEIYTASGRIQTTFNIIVAGKILAQYKMVYPSTLSVVYFYVDNLNSRRVVLGSTGTVLDRFRYSAWGVVTQDAGSDDYRSFTGKDYDGTGLIYFNARYYDPTTGRFLTEDPSRQGVNWYAYCGNNPVNRIDPSGRRFSADPHDTPTNVSVPGFNPGTTGGGGGRGSSTAAIQNEIANLKAQFERWYGSITSIPYTPRTEAQGPVIGVNRSHEAEYQNAREQAAQIQRDPNWERAIDAGIAGRRLVQKRLEVLVPVYADLAQIYWDVLTFRGDTTQLSNDIVSYGQDWWTAVQTLAQP